VTLFTVLQSNDNAAHWAGSVNQLATTNETYLLQGLGIAVYHRPP